MAPVGLPGGSVDCVDGCVTSAGIESIIEIILDDSFILELLLYPSLGHLHSLIDTHLILCSLRDA